MRLRGTEKEKREEEKNASPKFGTAEAEGTTLSTSRTKTVRRLTFQVGHKVVLSSRRESPVVMNFLCPERRNL